MPPKRNCFNWKLGASLWGEGNDLEEEWERRLIYQERSRAVRNGNGHPGVKRACGFGAQGDCETRQPVWSALPLVHRGQGMWLGRTSCLVPIMRQRPFEHGLSYFVVSWNLTVGSNEKTYILMHTPHPKDSDLISGVQPKLCNFFNPPVPPWFENHGHRQ